MRWVGSFQNRIREGAVINPPKLEKGMGATELCYTDRRAFIITGWSDAKTKDGWPKEIYLRRAKVECINYYAGAWKVNGIDEDNTNVYIIKVTRPFGKTPKYPKGGRAYTNNGTKNGSFYDLGYADEYKDPSF